MNRTAYCISGKDLAEEMRAALAFDIASQHLTPGVAVVLVGNDPASHLYVSLKEKAARAIGIEFHKYIFGVEEGMEAVRTCIAFLRDDPAIDGIIVQLPLPRGYDTDALIAAIGPDKDVDGFHPDNLAAFAHGTEAWWPVFPHALTLLMQNGGQDLSGKRAALIVNSELFGATLAVACTRIGLTPTIIVREKITCMAAAILSADVVVTACGVAGLVTAKMIKRGAIVIDGGIVKNADGTITGDVERSSVDAHASAISPVPGGVGPLTIACLLANVVEAHKRQHVANPKKDDLTTMHAPIRAGIMQREE